MLQDLTSQQVTALCDRFAALSPAAQRQIFADYLGAKSAINLFEGKGETFAETSELLGRLEIAFPKST